MQDWVLLGIYAVLLGEYFWTFFERSWFDHLHCQVQYSPLKFYGTVYPMMKPTHPRRIQSQTTLLWKPLILHKLFFSSLQLVLAQDDSVQKFELQIGEQKGINIWFEKLSCSKVSCKRNMGMCNMLEHFIALQFAHLQCTYLFCMILTTNRDYNLNNNKQGVDTVT